MTQDRGLEYADISTWMINKEVGRSKQLAAPSLFNLGLWKP